MEQELVNAQMSKVMASLGKFPESFPSGKGIPRVLGLWKCSDREYRE